MLVTHSMRMTFGVSLLFLVAAFSAMWPGQARAECEVFLPCTINFDGACPDAQELCDASFVGNGSCFFAGKAFCYSSGLFSYLVEPVSPVTITLSADLIELQVFFAHVGAGASGEMRFFNAADDEIGMPIQTNGDCLAFMPDLQTQVFVEGVRRIEVTATGGRVYIDDFTGTLQQAPGGPPDFDGDCDVGAFDLAQLLGSWGACPIPCEPGDPGGTCPADLDGNCDVGAFDLALLLGSWGPQ